MRTYGYAVSLFALALQASPLLGQTLLLEQKGATWYEGFGTELALLGDLDADGVRDWAVGAPCPIADLPAVPGRAVLYSGATRTALFELHGATPGGQFGWAFADVGDLDQDGHDDLLVAAPDIQSGGHLTASAEPGTVYCISGATGGLLFRLFGEVAGEEFGAALAPLGDIDGDQIIDFAVASPHSSVGGGPIRPRPRLLGSHAEDTVELRRRSVGPRRR